MHFSNPSALLLLLSLPVWIYLGPLMRGAFRGREILSLSLRLIIVTSLILALAGLATVQPSNRLAVVFLLDGSDSIPPTSRSAAEAFIQASMETMGPDDQTGVIVFGRDALVERPLSTSRVLGVLRSVPGSDQTNLEEAIHLALALLPPDAARRIVILSDGAQTSGDAETAGRLAAASGVQIVSVPLPTGQAAEVLIKDVSAPSHLREGEKFDLLLSIEASQPVDSQIRVFANGQLIYEGSQSIQRGQQTYSLPLQANPSLANSGRFIRYQVQIDPQLDGYYQNNRASTFSQMEGPPRLLVIAPAAGEPLPYRDNTGPAVRPDEAAQLLQVITEAGYQAQTARPSGLPGDLSELANYDGVVLVDVPARELTGRQMNALQSYVRDLGGGLLVVGGPTSYGVGGYFRTPLEDTLPVEMQMKDQLRRPNLTMVFVIDHSGSMGESSGGISKLDLAKEAASRSIELLNPTDRVGVIAFDDSASWVVPISDLSNPQSILSRIGTLRDGGGTDILAGLQAMAQALPDDPATVKHVILLTDGGANPAGIPELVTRMYDDYGITLTTVGVGSDAAPYLANLAELGGGRYHFAPDPGAIPRIFTEETSLASRSYIIERTFTPVRAASSAILSGVGALPALRGYIGTTARPVAQTILVSDLNDPILAAWQYGLGRAVAFTSDASGRWASNWLNWQGFPTFWSQVIQSILPNARKSALTLQVEQHGENASLIVDAQTEDGAFLDDYRLQANIATPDGEIVKLDLIQNAPGQYMGTFAPQAEGAYLIGVTGQAPNSQPKAPETIAETAGWVRSYSPEYRPVNKTDDRTLAKLADLTGGWVITGGEFAGIFSHDLPAGVETSPVWPWLLALAAILLPLDIAVRRLALTAVELRQALTSLAKRILSRPAPQNRSVEQQRTSSLAAFMRAKQRTEKLSESLFENADSKSGSPATKDEQEEQLPFESRSATSLDSQFSATKSKTEDASSSENSTAASLLAAKRKRKRQK